MDEELSSKNQMFTGPDPVIDFYKKDIDRSLIRRNLKLTVQERFEELMRLQEFAEELQRAGKRARLSHDKLR